MDILTIFMLIVDVLFVLAAVQLTRIATVKRLPNLYWLAGNFALAGLSGLIGYLTSVPIINTLGLILSSLCTILFVQKTFYRDRKSPFLILIAIVAVSGIFQVYYTYVPHPSGITLTYFGYTIIWGWQALIAYQTYRTISPDRTVEDWVKARYLMWMSYTLIIFLLGVKFFFPYTPSNAERVISSILIFLTGIAQYLTWVMPEPLRLWLNRNYKPVVPETLKSFSDMTEEELLQQIDQPTQR